MERRPFGAGEGQEHAPALEEDCAAVAQQPRVRQTVLEFAPVRGRHAATRSLSAW